MINGHFWISWNLGQEVSALKMGGGGRGLEPPSELSIGGFNLSEAKSSDVLNLFPRKE